MVAFCQAEFPLTHASEVQHTQAFSQALEATPLSGAADGEQAYARSGLLSSESFGCKRGH